MPPKNPKKASDKAEVKPSGKAPTKNGVKARLHEAAMGTEDENGVDDLGGMGGRLHEA
jgi:hypothetical protein